MNNVIETMLSKYNPKNNADRENAIKEIIQEIALSGLSKGGFFEKAAFYGGTCLRIFHGLNRFSEDLDFALLHADPSFRLDDYLPFLKNEFSSYGIDLDVEKKTKGEGAEIQSAFLKGNTLMLMMSFFPKNEEAQKVVSNQEAGSNIDCSPPLAKYGYSTKKHYSQGKYTRFYVGTIRLTSKAAIITIIFSISEKERR